MSALGIETQPPVAQRTGDQRGLPAQVVVPNEQLRVVSAPLAGLVEQILVATQQQVRRGQVVARMRSPGLADVQHTFLQAATQVELARTQLQRDERLFSEGIIAESRLQATRARSVEIAADYAERTQALRLVGMTERAIGELRAGRRVESTIDLVAPDDGVVLELAAVVGQRVEAAAVMLRIARLDPLWLEIQLPVARLAGVVAGASVGVPGSDAEAKVIVVGRNINPVNQTVTVRAITTRGAARLRPGQSVEVSLATVSAGGEWEVPNAALSRTGGVAVVFVRSATGFSVREVRVVSEGVERSLIGATFSPSEQIAVKGIAALKAALAGIGGP